MIRNLRFRKIARDLWLHKGQTLLVVLAIGISVLCVSGIARARFILVRSLNDMYAASRLPQAVFQTSGFDDDTLDIIRAMPEVQVAEGVREERFRIKFRDGVWYALKLVARAGYDDLQTDKIWLEAGGWPAPATPSIVLERSICDLTAAAVGDTVVLYNDEMGETEVQVVGLAYAPTETPSRFTANKVIGYTTLHTLTQLVGRGGRKYNRLYLVMADTVDVESRDAVLEIIKDTFVENRVAADYGLVGARTRHPLVRFVDTAILILSILGLLGALLSVLWITNIMTGLMARERAHIGVMKAMGFRGEPIGRMYLGEALALGAVAFLVGAPLGFLTAVVSSHVVAKQLNVDITTYRAPATVYGLELSVGLLTPALAALYPVLRGTRVTVRQALQRGPSAMDQFGVRRLDKLLKSIHGVSPHVLYPLRNLWRRKARLVLTLLTLMVAGAIFLTVMSLGASLRGSFEDVVAYWREDIQFETHYPVGRAIVQNELLFLPGVVGVEARLVGKGARLRPDGTVSSGGINVVGLPPKTPFLEPTLLDGRWLRSGELNDLVVDVEVLEDEPDIAVGDQVTLYVAGHELSWRVVGIATGQLSGYGDLMVPVAYANYHYLSEMIGLGGKANQFLVETERHDDQFQAQVESVAEFHP